MKLHDMLKEYVDKIPEEFYCKKYDVTLYKHVHYIRGGVVISFEEEQLKKSLKGG